MIELQNVKYTVSGAVREDIVDGISLTIEDNAVTLLTGPNGGGKSTVAKLIMGILTPTSGKILLDGEDITSLDVTERARRGIGYAFQIPPRFKGLTVRRLLNLAHGSPLSDDGCCAYLSKVGLCSMEYLDRALDASLSGGEIKRIEVASILARQLRLAMYDEPEAGIDMWSFSMLVNTFKLLGEKKKNSILLISHQERIMSISDRIAVIADGKIVESGPRDELYPKLIGMFNKGCSIIRTEGNGDGC